jgi:L-idonate 5-dehydrogenase
MRALVIHAPKDLRIDTLEDLEPGPGQVRINIAVGGVCGSDLHYYHHGGFGAVRIKEPMIPGHEVSGHIAQLGAGVSGLEVGAAVAICPSRPCAACRYCLEGKANHCTDMRFYGSAMRFPHIQGAFAQAVVADASQCVVAASDSLTPGELAMAEPLSVALHAVRRAGDMLGARVLVTGCGPIGVLVAAAARRAGATEIVVTDVANRALEHALGAGADRVINVTQNADAMDAYAADKGYFDVVFEASGVASALSTALQAIRARGVLVQVGLGAGDVSVPMNLIVAKEIDLRGTFRFHEEFHWAVELMSKQLIDVKPLITATYAMEDAVAAFEIAGDRERSLKTHITFN